MKQEDRVSTDIRCDHCGRANLDLAPGSETSRMLSCPKCHQFHYWVGSVWCMGWADDLKDFPVDKAKRLLAGHTTLRPEVAKRLADMQQRWGLKP